MNPIGTNPTLKREEANRIEYRTWFSSDSHGPDPIETGVLAMVCEVYQNGRIVAHGIAQRPLHTVMPLYTFGELKRSQTWLDMQSEALSKAEAALGLRESA